MKKTFKILIIFIISLTLNTKNIHAEEIPKVFLSGNIEEMQKKTDERKITLTYVSNDFTFKAYTKIKIQGNSSLTYDKKNYTIKLYEDKNHLNKKNVELKTNWGEQNKYVLKANWIDKTHSRNIVTSNLISTIQKKYNLLMDSPNNGQIDGFPVEVYINNEFLGLYTWNMPKDNWTLNMDNNNPDHIAIISNKHDEYTKFQKETTLKNTNSWEIEVGPETEDTINKFNRLIKFIKNSSDNEFKNNFHKYLNLDATLNYYTILNFAKLSDNVHKNMLLITYDGKIWYPTLYDLDTSWGTSWKGDSTTDYTEDLNDYYNENLLWSKFQKNFAKEIADRYFELRKEILTKDNIINKFNTFYKSIPTETLVKEQEKWGKIPGYSISQIEEFLDARIPVLDKQMYEIYNIPPQVNIEYSTQKPTLKPVTVTLNPNRNDIIIVKNGKKSYDYTYTFNKNGTYTFEYQDWYGKNLGTLTLEINCIKTQTVINIIIALLIIIVGITLYLISSKKQNNTPLKEKTTKKLKKETKKKTTKKKTNTNKSPSKKTTHQNKDKEKST